MTALGAGPNSGKEGAKAMKNDSPQNYCARKTMVKFFKEVRDTMSAAMEAKFKVSHEQMQTYIEELLAGKPKNAAKEDALILFCVCGHAGSLIFFFADMTQPRVTRSLLDAFVEEVDKLKTRMAAGADFGVSKGDLQILVDFCSGYVRNWVAPTQFSTTAQFPDSLDGGKECAALRDPKLGDPATTFSREEGAFADPLPSFQKEVKQIFDRCDDGIRFLAALKDIEVSTPSDEQANLAALRKSLSKAVEGIHQLLFYPEFLNGATKAKLAGLKANLNSWAQRIGATSIPEPAPVYDLAWLKGVLNE